MERESPAPDRQVSFENHSQRAAAYLTHLLFSPGELKEKEYKDRIEWFLL